MAQYWVQINTLSVVRPKMFHSSVTLALMVPNVLLLSVLVYHPSKQMLQPLPLYYNLIRLHQSLGRDTPTVVSGDPQPLCAKRSNYCGHHILTDFSRHPLPHEQEFATHTVRDRAHKTIKYTPSVKIVRAKWASTLNSLKIMDNNSMCWAYTQLSMHD